MFDPHMTEYRAACRGVLPATRVCVDELDASFWFMCVFVALRAPRIAATVTTIVVRHVPHNDTPAARRGRTTPHVRR